jgi:signal transduction histidine kinase
MNGARRVSGARRLSLRARMLVLLITVTTILLLIMGGVSTIILARSDNAQFDNGLVSESAASPEQIHRAPQGYAAVEVTDPGHQIRALSGHTSQTIALTAALRQLARRGELPFYLRTAAGQPRCRSGPGCPSSSQVFALPQEGGVALRATSRYEGDDATTGGGVTLFVAQSVSSATRIVRGFIIAELITGAALIALLAIGGEWLIGRGLEPLGQMASTAHDITSRGDLTARMPEADDQTEVGRLGAAINTMLDRIQQAFGARLRSEQKVREFAADASHELRTPLTTIRGYAELYRQGALGPDQLPSAMRRIEQEADRMSTLVAELLELARLDRTSSLDLTETDLASVVRDAVADAVAVEPRRPVRAEAPPRLVAVVDERRIRQVLANLLGNVRAHTPVTTPVAVRLGTITGGILIEVADSGPGMSAADAARAFDRFHRAVEREPDPAQPGPAAGHRPERSGGSGLGLSIVAAIASAHGGRATLESVLGRGTKVRVWLPSRAVS